MQSLQLSTLAGKLFWSSQLVFCLAFAAFYFLTQNSHQSLVMSMTSGEFANFAQQDCPAKFNCEAWELKHQFNPTSKKFDAVLNVPYQYFKKVSAAQYQESYNKQFELLPWNVKRQMSGNLKVVAVNLEVKNKK